MMGMFHGGNFFFFFLLASEFDSRSYLIVMAIALRIIGRSSSNSMNEYAHKMFSYNYSVKN